MLIPSSRNWFETSVLGQSTDSYADYLRRRGYCAGTVQVHVSSVGHFAYWLTRCGIQLSRVDEALVHQFVTEHLPVCTCSRRCQRRAVEMRAALSHLLPVLRAEGRIPAAHIQVPSAVHDELQRYDSFLEEICGLAPATRISRLSWVGKFLVNRFGSSPVDLGQICPHDIVEFMVRPDDSYRPGTMGVLASAVRSYLRFRSLACGEDVQRLLAAVPSVAQWSLATLPSHLTPEEVSRFLTAFDQHSVSGLRGYAMARCLLDMGLRAGEVAAIQLDDLNWREGTVTIGRGKSRRAAILPLPVPTGKVIVRYLRRARPKSESRCLFLRHRAPFDAPITAEFVRGHIRRALASCGLDERFTGTHVLRHTTAVRMRCAGASLKEIADVLRHRSLDTTTIYTKLDVPMLAAVAAPWPGGQS
jgi:integrase/recombinase XerD